MIKPKIYISSTFFDLEDHRTALIEALRDTECFDVVNMENYGTRSQSPLEKCLEDVTTSEFYVLLLGKRYGFIPEGKKYSITNLEYKTAIGDTDETRIAGTPDKRKIVLPFIIKEEYSLNDTVLQRIQKEQQTDGEELTRIKQGYLDALKAKIRGDFVISPGGFTSPADLCSQVLSALINQLVRDKKLSLVNKMKLHDEIVYRCNREQARNGFLLGNFSNKNFYRVYIVHGEDEELPVIFSNNISSYELQVRKIISLRNLDDFFTDDAERFIQRFILRLYQELFPGKAETMGLGFKQLAMSIIDSDTDSLVIKTEIDYLSWKEKYKPLLAYFFKTLQQVNTELDSRKSVYLLLNIIYSNAREKLKENPEAAIVLERLGNVKISHIKQWVQTYFVQNTDTASQNSSEELAQEIISKHFPDRRQGAKGFSMQVAIKKLKAIVDNFNSDNEQTLF